IGYDGELCPGLFLKGYAEEVGRSSYRPERGLSGVGFQPSDQFIKVVYRHRFPCKHDQRISDEWRDRLEIIQHVVWKRTENAVQNMPAQGAEADRIAIGPRARDAIDTDAPVSPADVFHDDGLSKRVSHPLGEHSSDYIRRAAWCKRNNHRDGPRRVGL